MGSNDPAISVAGSGKIDVPFSAEINPADPFTIEFWVNPAVSPAAGGFAAPLTSVNLGAGRSGYIFYQTGSGKWQFRLGNAGGYIGTAEGGAFTVGSWNHIVGV